MRCKQIQKMLLTGYLDDELDPVLRRRVSAHIEKCAYCREFEKQVKEIAIDPFDTAGRPLPPEIVWENIKNRVENGTSRRFLRTFFWDMKRIIGSPRPLFGFATVAVLLVVLILPGMQNRAQDRRVSYFLAEELDFFDSLEDENGIASQDIGIPMEDLFW